MPLQDKAINSISHATYYILSMFSPRFEPIKIIPRKQTHKHQTSFYRSAIEIGFISFGVERISEETFISGVILIRSNGKKQL
jgi:hypothetical protein